MESEKTTLKKSLDEAKAVQDEALAMANSLRTEYEKQIRVAKVEVEENVARAMFERDEAMKVLGEGMRGKATEELIRKEANDATRED